MLEYDDVPERREQLAGLIGVEDNVWVRIGDHDKVYAIADEDIERETDEKTSSVHFMRFELTPEMVATARAGTPITAGCDHANLSVETTLSDAQARSLRADPAA